MNIENTTGRFLAVRKAFARHFSNAIKELIPVTPNLEEYVKRERMSFKLKVAEDRMIDKVESVLEAYQNKGNNGTNGQHSPMPVIFLAFGKDLNPPTVTDMGKPVSTEVPITLKDDASGKVYYYKARTTNLECRVQACFMGYEDESIRAMTAQMRAWFQASFRRFFDIEWQFGGHKFNLRGSIDDVNFSDVVADLDGRPNLTAILWDFNIRFQMIYISAPDLNAIDENGKVIGYPTLQDVMIDIWPNKKPVIAEDEHLGFVSKDTHKHGEWPVERHEKDR